MYLEFIPFIFFLAASVAIGFFTDKKTKKADSFYLGDRSLGWFLLMMTFIGTQIGGGFILGTAEAAYQQGIYGISYSLGLSIGFLALGLGIGSRIRTLELSTAADVFNRFYNRPNLKKYASLLSIISLTGILIAQAVSLKKFLISTNLTSDFLFVVAWAAVIVYTTKGGFLAVVWTDMVQAIVMIAMLLIAFTFTLANAVPLPEAAFTFSNDHISPSTISYLIMPLLFMFIEQDMVQRCSAGKDKRQVTIACSVAALVLFALAALPVYFGMLAKEMGISPGEGSVFMEVIKKTTNPFVTACAALSVLLAIISTASSLLLAVSSNLVQDFQKKDKPFSIWKSRCVTIMIGLIALIISYTATEIIPVLIMSYELAVDSLFIPLMAAVIWKEKLTRYPMAATLSVLLGSCGFLLQKIAILPPTNVYMPLLLSLGGYIAGIVLNYLIEKKKNDLRTP